MVWLIISCQGTGCLYILEETMRQSQYIKVLFPRILPQIREWFPNNEFILIHDSSPCHKAKTVTKFLKDKNVKVLEWLRHSPDLNRIDNLWELMEWEISKANITNKCQ